MAGAASPAPASQRGADRRVLDRQFGEGGAALLPVSGAPADIDLAPDGASVLVGNRAGSAGAWVVRLRPDGALDRRFDEDGRLDVTVGAGTALEAVVATADGRVLTGIVKADTPEALEIEDADARRIKIAKDEIDERRPSDVSIMPNGLAEGLTPQDFADLIAYLETLKEDPAGQAQPGGGR